jgi:hypothetical protein
MRAVQWILCAMAMWLASSGAARGAVEVEVLETYPAGDAVTLGANQNYYLRIAYRTDAPEHNWARPWFQGREVATGSHPSPEYEGSGEALGWFFLEPGQQVDEVRIRAGNGSPDGTRQVASYRVRVVAGSTSTAGAEPQWIATLKARAEQLSERERQAAASRPDSIGDMLLFGGFMLAVPVLGLLAFAAPAWALWRWRGGWRIAAAVPAAMMAFLVLRFMVGTAFDQTSHILWPFEILQAGILGLVVLMALWLVRRFTGTGIAR